MASSTTRPMASTRASRVRVLMVKPRMNIRRRRRPGKPGWSPAGSGRPEITQEEEDDRQHQQDGLADGLEHCLDGERSMKIDES